MSDENLLSSWKEIADHLDCSVKTCARWEKEAGLPARRVNPGDKRSRVFALKTELDAWLADRQIFLRPETAKRVPAKGERRRTLLLAAASFLLIGAPAAWFLSGSHASPSVPVIAMREISADSVSAPDRYLAKQLTEKISQRLGFGGRIRVVRIGRSAAAFSSGETSPSGPRGTDYFFQASLMPIGRKFSLAVDLKDSRTGRSVYADTLIEPAGEFGLRLQSVCEEIRQRIPEAAGAGVPEPAVPRGEAYTNILKGGYLLSAVGIQESDPLALYYEGVRYAGLGEAETNELAMTIFKKAVEMDPSFAPGYLGLAQCYSNYVNYEGRYDPKWLDKAESLLDQAQARSPDLAEYFTLRIKALLLRDIVFGGDRSRAYFDLAKKALALHPFDGRLSYVVGHCYLRLFEREGRESDFDKALGHYKTAWAFNPFALSNLTYAELLMLRREFGRALQVVEGVLEGRPSPFSAFVRGAILYYQGNLEGSRAAFELCDSPVEQKIAALYFKAMIAARRQDRPGALSLIRQIDLLEIRKEPMYLDHLRSASIYAGLGDTEKAMDSLRVGYGALGTLGPFVMKRYVEIDPNFDRLPGNFVARRMTSLK